MDVAPDADDPEILAAKKAEDAARRSAPPKWPPKTGPDVYRRWAHEVKECHPKWIPPKADDVSWGEVGSFGKKLLKRFEPDDLLAVMRVAIWDWAAMRGTNPFYAQTPIPTLREILRFAEQLAAKTKGGWNSHEHRVSAYKTKFVIKLKPEDIIDMSDVAEACRGRRRA